MKDTAMPADDRVAALEEGMRLLMARVTDLEAENERLTAGSSTPTAPSATPGLGRRRLLVGGATAGAAAVAGLVATGQPAAADNGEPFLLGAENTATSETKLDYSGTANNGLRVQGTSSLPMIEGYQGGVGAGVKGANTSATGPGVVGIANGGAGVYGESTGLGVVGTSTGTASGVYGSSTATGVTGVSTGTGDGINGQSEGTGVAGISTGRGNGIFGRSEGYGVHGQSTGTYAGVVGESSSTGVYGVSDGGGDGVYGVATGAGYGVLATSNGGIGLSADGPTASLLLVPHLGRAAPTGDATSHGVGEVVADATGGLWYCTAAGAPGTWRKLGGIGTSGQLHVLPAPARVYDSRPGTLPAVGPKTKFTANETRTFDLKVNSSTVPAGATAALVTILLVNASTTAGNATIWANGVTKPLANTMVWGGTAGRFTATATTALDTSAMVRFNASQVTDLVLDVVGYYR